MTITKKGNLNNDKSEKDPSEFFSEINKITEKGETEQGQSDKENLKQDKSGTKDNSGKEQLDKDNSRKAKLKKVKSGKETTRK